MRHIVILNPRAGKRDCTAEIAAEAKRVFSEMGLQYSLEYTRDEGHAKDIAMREAESKEEVTIYACGGDGTISEAAQALYNAPHVTLAPVPLGTGNDFIRTITAEKEKYSLSELVSSGKTVSADMMLAGGKVAVNIVSVGLDASIANNVYRFKRIPFISGSTAYNLSTAFCFFTNVRYRMGFEIDGKVMGEQNFIFAVAANAKYYGGGFKAAPIADIRDGLMDFITVPALPRIKMLPMIERYRRGEHLERYDFIKLIRCQKIKILSPKPVALNCDGEISFVENPTIELLPGQMKLLVPQKYLHNIAKDDLILQK